MTKPGKFQDLTESGDHSAVWPIEMKNGGLNSDERLLQECFKFRCYNEKIEVICFLKKYPEL